MNYYLGEIRAFAFSRIPQDWMACDGRLLSIVQYQALFSLLGTNYGGDGRTTFGLPDLRGRILEGFAGTKPIGTKYGTENVTINVNEMPAHTHAVNAQNAIGSDLLNNGEDYPAQVSVFENGAGSNLYSVNGFGAPANLTPLHNNSISYIGGSQSHENRQPFLTMSYCILTTGIFPSRN